MSVVELYCCMHASRVWAVVYNNIVLQRTSWSPSQRTSFKRSCVPSLSAWGFLHSSEASRLESHTIHFTYPHQNIVSTYRTDTIHRNERLLSRSWPVQLLTYMQRVNSRQLVAMVTRNCVITELSSHYYIPLCIYIYIYMCVCVCVCVCMERGRLLFLLDS
jgi:hypothetical protein